jgi:tetratricopeptide (TPR) repeat protein
MTLAREAKTMARRLSDPATLVAVINDCAIPLRVPSTLRTQLADILEARAIAEHTGDLLGQFWAAAHAYIETTAAGQFDLADRCLATEEAISIRLQDPTMVWVSAFQETSRALRQGEPDRAEELATRAFEIGSASEEPDAFTYYGSHLMVIRDQQGRLAELVDLIADVGAQNPGMPVYKAVLAWARCKVGDHAGARQLLDAAAANAFDVPLDSTWIDSLISYATVAVELQLPERAEQLFALLAPYHDQVPCQGVTSREPVAMYLGGLATVSGGYDDANRYFQEAHELNLRGAMHYAEAQDNLWWARMLQERNGAGDAERAARLLEKARSASRERGYPHIESQAAAL